MDLSNPDIAAQTLERLRAECEAMKHRLELLLDSKGRISEEIHAIRKLGKSLRGGFSLFGLAGSSSPEIQAIGRLLSGPRDATSRHNTWIKLGWKHDPIVASAIGLLLEQQTHSAARRPPCETIDWCQARVDAALAALQELQTDNPAVLITEGMRKLQRKAFKRCQKLTHRNTEDFHEARKAVKALLGAASHLPEGVVSPDPSYEKLAELLGDENDLATLSVWLEAHGFTKRFAPDLWKTIGKTREKLREKAIMEAASLAPENPA